RWRLGHDLPQSLQVSVDVLRWREGKALLRLSIRQSDAGEPGQPRAPRPRFDQQLLARGRLFSHPASDFEMVRSIGPRSLDLSLHGGFLISEDDRVGREKVQQVRS